MKKKILYLLGIILVIVALVSISDAIRSKHNEFVRTGDLNVSRTNPTAIELLNGKVLVFGGWFSNENKKYELKVEIYDPKTRKFSFTGDLNDYHGYSNGVYAKKYYTINGCKNII